MFDGAELARALTDHDGDHECVLATYKYRVFVRSQPIAQLSARNLTRIFRPDAPTSVLDLFDILSTYG